MFSASQRRTVRQARRRPHGGTRPTLRSFATAAATCSIAVASIGFPSALAAPPNATAGDPTSWTFGEGPVELTGLDPTTKLGVRVPPGWSLTGPAVIDLDYRYPSLLDAADVAVSVNGRIVDVWPLLQRNGSARLTIGSQFFDRVDNEIVIESAFRLADDLACPDPSHPARQLEIAPSTRLSIPIAPTRAAELSQITKAFEPLGNTGRPLEVTVAPDATSAELSAVAHIVGAIRDGAENLIDISLVDPTDPLNGNPRIVAQLEPSENDDRTGTISSELVSETMVLSLTASDTEALLEVAAVAAGADRLDERPNVTVQSPTTATVDIGDEVGETRTPPRVIGDTFTLDELGYDTRTLRGPGSDSTTYGFDVEVGDTPTSMSVAIDAVRSSSSSRVDGVSLIVNGARVGTVEFDDDEGRLDDAIVNVTGADLRPGRNTIKIEADFDDLDDQCGVTRPDQSIDISNTTDVTIRAERNTIDLDLDDLPYTFRDAADSDRLVIVLPDDPTPDDQLAAINMAGLLGHPEAVVRIASPDELDADERRSSHLVVLGEVDRQPLFDWLLDNGARPALAESTTDTPSASGPTGTVEIMPNPVDDRRIVMTVGGDDDLGSALAYVAVLERAVRADLRGAVATVTTDPADETTSIVESNDVAATAVRRLTSASFDRDAVDGGELDGGTSGSSSTSTSSSSSTSSSTSTSTSTSSTTPQVALSSASGGASGPLPLVLAGLAGVGGLVALAVVVKRRRSMTPATAA